MSAAPILVTAVVLLVWASNKKMSGRIQVAKNLNASDFVRGGINWLPRMSPALVDGLDRLFAAIAAKGGRAYLSPHAKALGRTDGSKTSQHYYEPGREVNAADVMVSGIPLEVAYNVARNLGVFSGIGAYNDTRPDDMLHVDTRPDRSVTSPALWSRVAGSYGAVMQAFV